MGKLLFSIGIIAAGLAAGYLIQVLARKGTSHASLRTARRTLQKIALLGLNPIAAFGAIWAFHFADIRIALLPALGLLTLVSGGAAALLLGRLLGLQKGRMGAFFCSGAMFNIGSIGALLVFVFLGETGFALVPFFRLFEEFSYYAFGFPIAKSFSPVVQEERKTERLKRILVDPFVLMAVGSILLGFLMNLSGLPRPVFYASLNRIVIPLASFLLLLSIGMAMRFERVGKYVREGFIVAGIKYLIVPVAVTGSGYLLGLGRIDNGLPLQVVLMLSSMPVGFIALVPPSLYELDVDLANTAWLITTACLLLIIPLQMVLIRLI